MSGLPLIDFEAVEREFPPAQCQMFVAVGYARMNQLRAQKYAEAKRRGYPLVSYVSSRCTNLTGVRRWRQLASSLRTTRFSLSCGIGSNVTLWSGR